MFLIEQYYFIDVFNSTFNSTFNLTFQISHFKFNNLKSTFSFILALNFTILIRRSVRSILHFDPLWPYQWQLIILFLTSCFVSYFMSCNIGLRTSTESVLYFDRTSKNWFQSEIFFFFFLWIALQITNNQPSMLIQFCKKFKHDSGCHR